MYDAPSEPSDNDNVSILYAKSEADLVEYSSGTQPNRGDQAGDTSSVFKVHYSSCKVQ